MLEFQNIQKLAKAALRGTAVTFSVNGNDTSFNADAVNAALRNELDEMTKDYYTFKRNELAVYELMSQTLTEVLPKKVMQQYEQFADVQSIAQGDKAVFRLRVTEAAKKRAKAFVTRVGLAGRYETAILDGRELTVNTSAVGYAIRIGFEEFLDGRYSFADFTDIMLEGMNEYIYAEIAKALVQATEELPTANKYTGTAFDEAKMDQLLAISDSYGNGASTIFCTKEFAYTMKPASADWASSEMKNTLWENGMFTTYKNHPVVILEQSMVDATNTEKVIDPSKAFIMANVGEKPVKVVFEGATQVRSVEDNDDWSRDLQSYTKFGVAVFSNPSICVFENTSLTKATN